MDCSDFDDILEDVQFLKHRPLERDITIFQATLHYRINGEIAVAWARAYAKGTPSDEVAAALEWSARYGIINEILVLSTSEKIERYIPGEGVGPCQES